MLEIDRGPSASELRSIPGYTPAPATLDPPEHSPRHQEPFPQKPELFRSPSYQFNHIPKHLRHGHLVADDSKPLRRCPDHLQVGGGMLNPFLPLARPMDDGSLAGVHLLLPGWR